MSHPCVISTATPYAQKVHAAALTPIVRLQFSYDLLAESAAG